MFVTRTSLLDCVEVVAARQFLRNRVRQPGGEGLDPESRHGWARLERPQVPWFMVAAGVDRRNSGLTARDCDGLIAVWSEHVTRRLLFEESGKVGHDVVTTGIAGYAWRSAAGVPVMASARGCLMRAAPYFAQQRAILPNYYGQCDGKCKCSKHDAFADIGTKEANSHADLNPKNNRLPSTFGDELHQCAGFSPTPCRNCRSRWLGFNHSNKLWSVDDVCFTPADPVPWRPIPADRPS